MGLMCSHELEVDNLIVTGSTPSREIGLLLNAQFLLFLKTNATLISLLSLFNFIYDP